MTNPDQDVTLDEMAKAVVEWMDNWNLIAEQYRHGKSTWVMKNGFKHFRRKELWTSLDVIREVEEALEETNELWKWYAGEIDNSIDGDYSYDKSEHTFNKITADPETRLKAINATLRESGEI